MSASARAIGQITSTQLSGPKWLRRRRIAPVASTKSPTPSGLKMHKEYFFWVLRRAGLLIHHPAIRCRAAALPVPSALHLAILLLMIWHRGRYQRLSKQSEIRLFRSDLNSSNHGFIVAPCISEPFEFPEQ